MRRTVYTGSAVRDIDGITAYIAEASEDRETAERFVATLLSQCSKLAALEPMIGRPRGELRPDLRSISHKSYIIFFRYLENTVEIVRIIERHRDIAAQFDLDAT